MKIYLNGKFIEEKEARVSLFDPGFMYGQGLFETMRAYNEKIFRVDKHIQRLFGGAALINLKLNVEKEELKSALKACLKKNDLKDAYLRLTAWQGEDRVNLTIFAKGHNFFTRGDYEKGFQAIISGFRQNEQSLLSRIKSSNYLNLLLAYQEARSKGFDEAIVLNTQGVIAEATRANIFIVRDKCLLTPALDCGCLPGITRETVLELAAKEGIKAVETHFTCEDIFRSEEAFLTNSLIELMPLVSLDGRPLKDSKSGKITRLLHKKYQENKNRK